MSRKRFCDLCDAEVSEGEHYFDVILRVMQDPENSEDELDQEYADFCDACVRSGKALTTLLAWYEERVKLPEADDAVDPSVTDPGTPTPRVSKESLSTDKGVTGRTEER